MSKPNKDGWIRHRGGKCPVEKGVLVDVRYRNGVVNLHVPALVERTTKGSNAAFTAASWGHIDVGTDIMSYRLHKPEQVEPSADGYTYRTLEEWTKIKQDKSKRADQKPDWNEAETMLEELEQSGKDFMKDFAAAMGIDQPKAESPLQWRDRIREIDSTVEALEEERVSLVQKLESEGFRLIDKSGKTNADAKRAHADELAELGKQFYEKPAEDMSDWRNWKAGDLVECIGCDGYGKRFERCTYYRIDKVSQDGVTVNGLIIGMHLNDFRWRYRPSA